MTVLMRQLGLVSESTQIARGDVLKVSAALQKQATRDLTPIWEISATVDAFDRLEDVPMGYWPIVVMDDIQTPGAAGIHEDKNGQPFALVTAASTLDGWSLTASHEGLEMLVDPFGNRLVAGDSPKSDQGRVNFLVEVGDPAEAADFGYSVNGILVSDFYTPHFFDPVKAPGVRYSFTGSLTEPRQVLRGGYLSWEDPMSGEWWQETWFDGDAPTFRSLGKISQSANGNARAAIDRITMAETQRACARGRQHAQAAGLTAAVNADASNAHMSALRQQIREILKSGAPASQGAKASGRRSAPSVGRGRVENA
jgi:hypothetical protein